VQSVVRGCCAEHKDPRQQRGAENPAALT